MDKEIHAGHRLRLRQRFLAESLDSFQPHEILEFLLFYGVPRMDTNELAHTLIEEFGSLARVMDAPYDELVKIKGISGHTAALIKLVPELSRIYLEGHHPDTEVLNTPQKIGSYLTAKFVGRTKEVVYLLCLDSSLNTIACEMIAEGSISASSIDIRLIVERVIRHNAYRIVLAHNHPRGLAIPSNDDVITTHYIKKSLESIGVELLDHVIVAGKEYCCLSERYPDEFSV